MNLFKANTGLLAPGVGDKRFFVCFVKCVAFVNSHNSIILMTLNFKHFNQRSKFTNILQVDFKNSQCFRFTSRRAWPAHVNGYVTLSVTYPQWIRVWSSTCWHLESSHRNLKHQSSLRSRAITGGCEKAALVSWRMDCWIGVIKYHVSANHEIICNTAHMTSIWVACYSCVELKLKINMRSLFDQALNSAHPSLLRSRCWPQGVFSTCLASHDLSTARFSYLARLRLAI